MEVTNTENQELKLKNKIEIFFKKSIQCRCKKGICITRDKLAIVMDKWSLLIIYNLGYYQNLRFSEIKQKINGISSKMLSSTLKKLEKNKIVKRTAYAEVPPRVVYELTPFGAALAERAVDLNDWLLDIFSNLEEEKVE